MDYSGDQIIVRRPRKRAPRFDPYKQSKVKAIVYQDLELATRIRQLPGIGTYFQGRMNALGIDTINDLLSKLNHLSMDDTHQRLSYYLRNAQAGCDFQKPNGDVIQINQVNVKAYTVVLNLLKWIVAHPQSQLGQWDLHLPEGERADEQDMRRNITLLSSQLKQEEDKQVPLLSKPLPPPPPPIQTSMPTSGTVIPPLAPPRRRMGPLHSSRIDSKEKWNMDEVEKSVGHKPKLLADIKVLEQKWKEDLRK